MIRALIFSKDRALQLDLLLRSFYKYISDAPGKATVLYSSTEGKYERQYKAMAAAYGGSAAFVREKDFRNQVLQILAAPAGAVGPPAAAATTGAELRHEREKSATAGNSVILFLVDDTVIIRPRRLEDLASALNAEPKALGYSLRLGRNTSRSYVLGRNQRLPIFEPVRNGTLRYRWPSADGDFGYPLEISSSIYRQEMILALMESIAFQDPNTLESALSLKAPGLARGHPYLLCAPVSMSFSIPANRVQAVFANRSGADPRQSVGNLAAAFDQGKRIDLAPFAEFIPNATHQEMEFRLEPSSSQA
jgi:hypothetical protein